MPRYHVTAELTASALAAVLRFTFDADQAVGRLVIDVADPGELRADGNAFHGSSGFHRLAAPADFRAAFAGVLDRPIRRWAPAETATGPGASSST